MISKPVARERNGSCTQTQQRLQAGTQKRFFQSVAGVTQSLHRVATRSIIIRKAAWCLSILLISCSAAPDAVLANHTEHDHSEGYVYLSPEEQHYLFHKKQIKICIDPDWMPYEKILNGKHVGISKDYMDLFAKMIGIPIALVPTSSWSQSLDYVRLKKCDILPLANKTPQREKIYNFTQPYFHTSMVIATDYGELYIDDISDVVRNKKIGLVKGYAMIEHLKKRYPKNHIVEVSNLGTGLEMVSRGDLYGVIDFLPTLGYLIQSNYAGKLKISAKFKDTMDLSIAARKDSPELLSILEKCIAVIKSRPKNDLLAIERKWTSLVIEKNPDYKLFYAIILAISIPTGMLAVRHYCALRYSKILYSQSRTDLLTGINNRRAFYERAKEFMQAHNNEDRPTGIAIIDIDRFKEINDNYGHDAGDVVIQHIAKQLTENTRSSDVVARIGGEEFAILLPHSDLRNSFIVAQNLKRKMAAAPISVDDTNPLSVTVSIGVSELKRDDSGIDQALKRADQALYQAKNNGRDQVVMFDAD